MEVEVHIGYTMFYIHNIMYITFYKLKSELGDTKPRLYIRTYTREGVHNPTSACAYIHTHHTHIGEIKGEIQHEEFSLHLRD